IWTTPAAGGDARELTAGFGQITARCVFGDPWRGVPWPSAHWSPDGSELFFLATIGGTVHLHSVPADGGEIRPLTRGRAVVTALRVAGDGIFFGQMTTTDPTARWYPSQTGDEPKRLTNLNGGPLRGMGIAEAEPLRFASHDGQPIDAWLIPPSDFDPAGT